MDINQVRYFLALADTLNFTRAAEQCFVSQPALTQSIKRLESELGGGLLYREGKDTRLTGLGSVLRAHFDQLEKIRLQIKATATTYLSSRTRECNIGIMNTIGPKILSPFLDAYQKENPDVVLYLHDVNPESVTELLLSGELDGVFSTTKNNSVDKLTSINLFEERSVVVFSSEHEFSNRESISLIDIVNELYVDRMHCDFRSDLLIFANRNYVDLKIAFRSQREDWVHAVVGQGAGVTIMPEHSLMPPHLESRVIDNPAMSRTVSLCTLEREYLSPALQSLWEMAQLFTWDDTIPILNVRN